MMIIESPVAGNIWQVNTQEGNSVKSGDCILILESMKMEIEINTQTSGQLHKLFHQPGAQVAAGTLLAIIDPNA